MAFTPATNLEAVEALYVGYFGRAGEPGGVQYWLDRMAEGVTFAQIAAQFSVQAEATTTHPFLANPDLVSPESFVTSLYNNLLERAPDAAGFDYWVGQLEAANGDPFLIGLLIAQFISGAQGTDIDTLQNKIDAAEYFTGALAAAGISGVDADGQVLPNIDAAATDIIGAVTSDDATVTAAAAATDDFVEDNANAGTIFQLSAGTDTIDGTTLNDEIQAEGFVEFNPFDNIDGNGGIDTIRVVSNGAGLQTNGATISEVENLEVTFFANAAAALDASQWGAALTNITMINHVASVNNINGDTITVRNATIEAADTFTADTGATAINVVLDGAVSGSIINADEETAGNLSTLSVSGSVTAPGALTLASNATSLDSVTLSLTSSGTINVADLMNISTLETFNGSGSTGNLTIDFDTATVGDELRTASVGSGNDTVGWDQFEANNETGGIIRTLNLGAGDDTLNLNLDAGGNTTNTREEITLGADNDLVVATEFGNMVQIATSADVEAGLVVFTDFNTAEDTLDVSHASFGPRDVLTNVELSDIADEANLLAALQRADDFTAASTTSVFEWQGSVYIYANDAAAAFSAGDTVIELAGVSLSSITASNVVIA